VNDDLRLIAVAAASFIATVSLGAYVAHRRITTFDVAANALRGRGTALAIVFTRSGYWPALTCVAVVLFAADLAIWGGVTFAVLLCATQLLSQWAAEFTKEAFARIRPDDWLFHQELGFSFPSGHATTAVVFYGGLLAFVVTSVSWPEVRLALGVVAAIFIAGIPWSRIVLSAHYGSDVLGGMLFGGAWLSLMMLVLRHAPQPRFL
jgi:membrane-associated phospholipid phosphatase